MVDAGHVGVALQPENSRRLVRLGMEIIEAANRQLTVKQPGRPEVNSVDVNEFYDAGRGAGDHGAGIVVYG